MPVTAQCSFFLPGRFSATPVITCQKSSPSAGTAKVLCYDWHLPRNRHATHRVRLIFRSCSSAKPIKLQIGFQASLPIDTCNLATYRSRWGYRAHRSGCHQFRLVIDQAYSSGEHLQTGAPSILYSSTTPSARTAPAQMKFVLRSIAMALSGAPRNGPCPPETMPNGQRLCGRAVGRPRR